MIAAINLNQLARMSAESIVNCMFEGMAIGFFAWILLRLFGRRNSSTRFAVWFSALIAIASLPILGVTASPYEGRAASITVPNSWAFDIFVVWALIAGFSLLRVGTGLLQLRKLRASHTAIDPATLDPLLQQTLRGIQGVRAVALCQSDRVQVPTAIGFLKPLVVIPSWTLQELSAAELNSILIHELAHLRRWDDWTNLAQQILKALLFFHPAVWWIDSQLALEREMACDDAVLAETGNARGYAQCLVAMAEKSFLRRGLALAQAAVSRMRQTSLRVSQILDVNRSSATRIWKPALYSVAAFFVVCVVLLSRAPELVAFQDRAPDVAAIPTNTTHGSDAALALRKYAMATPASFHDRSAAETLRQSRRIRQPQMKSLAPQNAQHRVGESASSLVSQSIGYRFGDGTNAAAPLSSEYRTRKGTSLLVPQIAENKSGPQPLRQGILEEARFSATAESAPRQAIFVVMQTTQYDEAGPTFWRISVLRVTLLTSTRPVESRIPTKQI
jgi:beta-lactamase regulating signal transducer with metallopeptidase domain